MLGFHSSPERAKLKKLQIWHAHKPQEALTKKILRGQEGIKLITVKIPYLWNG